MSDIQPVFSLVYTSVRAKIVPDVIKLWDSKAALNQHQWVVAVDQGDLATQGAAAKAISESLAAGLSVDGKVVVNTGAKDCVTGWNLAAADSTGKVLIAVADDFLPPVGWDKALMDLPEAWMDKDSVVKVEDGYVHDIFVLAILTRARYERFGYVFYPRYSSMFSDTEFGEVARRDGVVVDASHLLFEHLHPDCGKRPRDDVDKHHASQERWKSGEMLFNFRKACNFPLDAGPKAVPFVAPPVQKKDERYVAYLQVTKDDLCLLDVCRRLIEEGVKDFCFSQPDCYWSGDPLEPGNIEEVNNIVDALRGENVTVHQRKFKIDDYKVVGDSRIQIETRVRNASVEWIKSLGYQHVLIVDGDELWMRGTLDLVKVYVEQGHKVVSCKMIPVVGVPGYPVDSAADLAVIYIDASVTFKCCRSPFLRQTIIPQPLIYHFTGTRKGMEATVKKHRQSGHYDDPDYDFEGFIKDKLPNIAPGMKDIHMYRPYQIWPAVRAWRKAELEAMPESLRPYLGTETI